MPGFSTEKLFPTAVSTFFCGLPAMRKTQTTLSFLNHKTSDSGLLKSQWWMRIPGEGKHLSSGKSIQSGGCRVGGKHKQADSTRGHFARTQPSPEVKSCLLGMQITTWREATLTWCTLVLNLALNKQKKLTGAAQSSNFWEAGRVEIQNK